MSNKIIIVGAGIIGVTSAYFLARRGYQVEVVDAADDVAQATSMGNGGQLSYSYVEPMASPGMLGKLPGILLGRDHAIKMRWRWDPEFFCWGLKFLSECRTTRASANELAQLQLSLYSQQQIAALVDEHAIDFDYSRQGKLLVFGDSQGFDGYRRKLERLPALKHCCEPLDDAACRQLDPAIDSWADPIAGGIYAEGDESGDSLKFCQALREICQQQYGVVFRFGTPVERINHQAGRVVSVDTKHGTLAADKVVICAGDTTGKLLSPLKIRPWIQPVTGYSLTMPLGTLASDVCLTSMNRKMVFCRLGDRLRVAGFAHIGRFNEAQQQAFGAQLLRQARELMPQAGRYDEAEATWVGQRPVTPGSVPVVSATPVQDLFINSGHGSLGWTLSAGSGALLADIVAGQPTSLISGNYAL